MNKKVLISLLFIIQVLLGILSVSQSENVRGVLGSIGKVTIVVDPGHGGIDGGAESRSGVCEKDINLHIAMKIKEQAEAEGWRVMMTRETDMGLYSEGKGSIRGKKTEDLRNRQDLINHSGADASVSIHLNSYPSQEVKGAQTFYSKDSPEGKIIAEIIQTRIKEALDPENDRSPLPKDDIIIMKNNKAPLVLVECGFLSNDAEAEKLQNEEYQEKLAAVITMGLKEFFISTGKVKKEEIPVILSN